MREYQRDQFGETFSVDLVEPDFRAAIEAFGVPVVSVEPDRLGEALAAALADDGPRSRPRAGASGDVDVTDWNAIVRQSLIGLEPYRPGASLDELKEAYGLDEIVKLNWNEGLEGPFLGVEEVVAELDRAWIYPAEAYSDLREETWPPG